MKASFTSLVPKLVLALIACSIAIGELVADKVPLEKATVELRNGSTLVGVVTSQDEDSLVLETELGAIKLKPGQLSDTARRQFFSASRAENRSRESDALKADVKRLENLVAVLKKENEELRRELVSLEREKRSLTAAASTSAKTPSTSSAIKPTPSKAGYWLSSNSKVRHNSRCRWYMRSKGRACSANEGRGCKQCGG